VGCTARIRGIQT